MINKANQNAGEGVDWCFQLYPRGSWKRGLAPLPIPMD
jgi:hypothetical protein